MITNSIILAFGQFLRFIASFLSDGVGTADQFSTSASQVFSLIGGLNWLFPVKESVDIFRWTILLYMGIFMYKIFNWTANKFRGSGGSSK